MAIGGLLVLSPPLLLPQRFKTAADRHDGLHVASYFIATSGSVAPTGTTIRRVSETPSALLGLVIAGFYGGFVQAGVGFLLLRQLLEPCVMISSGLTH